MKTTELEGEMTSVNVFYVGVVLCQTVPTAMWAVEMRTTMEEDYTAPLLVTVNSYLTHQSGVTGSMYVSAPVGNEWNDTLWTTRVDCVEFSFTCSFPSILRAVCVVSDQRNLRPSTLELTGRSSSTCQRSRSGWEPPATESRSSHTRWDKTVTTDTWTSTWCSLRWAKHSFPLMGLCWQ